MADDLEFAVPVIRFFAPGLPKGQPRVKARAFKKGAKFVGRVYDPGTADEWKMCVVKAGIPHRLRELLTGPVCVELDFMMPRPKAHFRGKAQTLRADAPLHHTGTPDCDNLAKAVYDAITQAELFWKDDAQISDGRTTKRYGEEPGCFITITAL